MSPFWLLVIGLGTSWFIATGRAGAVWDVLTAPPNSSTGATLPPNTGNTPGNCSAGWHWDSALLACVPDQTP